MADKAHVAFFLPVLGGGGAERVMVRLANGLSSKVRMSFVLGSTSGQYMSEVGPHVNVVDLKTPRALLAITSVARYIKDEHPDAIMSTLDYANVSLLIASRLVRRRSTRIVVRQANAIEQFYRALPKLRKMFFLMKSFYPKADGVVAVSREVGNELVNLIRVRSERVALIPNPVDPQALAEKARASLEHPWRNSSSEPMIIGLGNLRKEKDFTTLVRAFHAVRKQVPCRLMLLGDGPQRTEIEQVVRELGLGESVWMPGFVANPYPYVASASALVLSSESEGMPNSLLEAMALGTNVVSTDCGSGPREVLEDGKYGRLTQVGNPEDMAEAIVAAIRSPLDPETLRRGVDRYAPEKVLGQYLEFLLGG